MSSHAKKRSHKRRKDAAKQIEQRQVTSYPTFPSHMELRWRTPVHADYMAAASYLWAA